MLWFSANALRQSMLPRCLQGRIVTMAESGHYPIEEQPPLLATIVERFLGE